MASVGSDVADSPDARSPGAATATPGSSVGGVGGGGGGGSGIKRAPDSEARDDGTAMGDGTSGAKKKKIATGSRGVANLTPEQLAKKRANGG